MKPVSIEEAAALNVLYAVMTEYSEERAVTGWTSDRSKIAKHLILGSFPVFLAAQTIACSIPHFAYLHLSVETVS